MNCSILVDDRLFIGCRDRKIFVFEVASLILVKTIETPESVHCLCSFKSNRLLATGMTDGYIWLLDC